MGDNLLENLATFGLQPQDIHEIFLSHIHGDHIGGLLDVDNNPIFPNATIFISRLEKDHFSNYAIFQVYEKRLRLFEFDGTFLSEGITPVSIIGHTPGHSGFFIQNGNDSLIVWGDLVHSLALQVRFPQISDNFDMNPSQAAESRQHFLANVANKKYICFRYAHSFTFYQKNSISSSFWLCL